jgi:O-acetyl-ADP-ribose deacetylase (regulator of RNase III)
VPTGGVAITGAGTLLSKAVIHAVGPVWHGGQDDEDRKLRSAVWESLHRAHERGFASIALPAISSGIFGFPVEPCAHIVLKTAQEFAEKCPASSLRDIRVVLYDQPTLDVFEREFQRLFPAQD